MTNSKPVLYVEDDDNDVFLMERAFQKLEITNPLRLAGDGKQAIDYLERVASGKIDRELCLVLLDLSMPGKHGLEVLKWIRNNPVLTGLPVIVLTSSNQESDIHRAFLLRANGFITKPGDATKLLNIVEAIREYWLAGTPPATSFVDFAAAANVAVLSGVYGPKGDSAKA